MNKISFFVLFLIIPGIVIAINGETGKNDAGGSTNDNTQSRKVTATNTRSMITFQSVGATSRPDKMGLELKATGKAPIRFRLRYFSHDTDASTSIHASLRVMFKSIIEYTDLASPADGYTVGVDTIAKQMQFNTVEWRNISAPGITTDSTTSVKTYSYKLEYPNPDDLTKNLFAIYVKFSEAPFVANGTSMTPNQVKFDIELSGWTFASSTNYLALECKVQSLMKRERHQNQIGSAAAQKCQVGGDNEGSPKAGLAWVTTVDADGTQAAVITGPAVDETADAEDDDEDSKASPETASRWYFSFMKQAPQRIFWDPLFEASSSPQLLVSLIMMIVPLLVLL